MKAGDRNKRVKFFSKTRTPDGGGGFDIVLTDVVEVWAKVVPLSFREQVIAQQAAIAAEYSVSILTRTDITADMIVVYQGVEHEIVGMPAPDKTKADMTLHIAKQKRG